MFSMTGYGEAQQQSDDQLVRIEIRSVNHRHLKLVSRLPDGYAGLESSLESVVRKHVRRGSLAMHVAIERSEDADAYQLNETVLRHYFEQLRRLQTRLGELGEVSIDALVMLPGVVNVSRKPVDQDAIWPSVEPVLEAALVHLNQMRRREGEALAADLRRNLELIATELDAIEATAPETVKAYEKRLLERINLLLEEHDVAADPATIVREVAVFADRVDISEEVVRLRSHLEQFHSIMAGEESPGRKLEFLIQELLRETNTIGSKANHAQVARHVVQIKTNIERLREMVQNVE